MTLRRVEIAVTESVEKQLGALPVVAQFSRQLQIAEIVNELCPIREDARVTHGEVIEALIANRLTSPKPMVHVADWAAAWAVEEVYGIAAGALGDDRIARALDAMAAVCEHVTGSVGAAAIAEFGIDSSRLHWDMTSISLYGAYDDVDEAFPVPGYGHAKDRRDDLKQIQAGIAVTGDGAIPLLQRVYDGRAGEVAQVVDAMTALQKMAEGKDFLLIGDSKLVSYGNVTAMAGARVTFIAPLAAARAPKGLFTALDPAAYTTVDYVAHRDRGKPTRARAVYHVTEDVMDLPGPRRSDPMHRLRRILVHCTANAEAQAAARAAKLDRARADLDKLVRTAGTYHYPTPQAVTLKAAQIAARRRITAYLRTHLTVDDAGKPVFTWAYDQQAIAADAAGDGWYALLTNIPADQLDAAAILTAYKGQPAVERRYGNFKGPLAVAPIFLHHNRRIAALITVICLALLIFCLVERETRANLAPETTIVGFYAFDNRAMRPTGRLILLALAGLRILPAQHGQPARILKPHYLQAQLLALLHVDITRPRWLTQ